jgi:predicted nucleotidyltransferase
MINNIYKCYNRYKNERMGEKNMYQHHKESIQNLIHYFEENEGVIAVILGGSVAKGLARYDSDIDALVVVTDAAYKDLEKENRLSECISGKCTYEGGYFDIKYCTKDYLKAVAQGGSEPSRNAYLGAKCLYTKDESLLTLLESIPVYQKSEKLEKQLSFYSTVMLNDHYFWGAAKEDIYLKTRTASDIVLFGLRLILAENEVLFPCQKSLLKTVEALEKKPEQIVKKAEIFLKTLEDEKKDDFIQSVLNFCTFERPKDYTTVLSTYVNDNELWWYKDRPVLAEW